MSSPLVSILIPCFNAAPWIKTALRSAQWQTWPRTEIIVVDDGSTDGSGEIVRTFTSSRCRVVHQERCGASAARNLALKLAQGDYIQYLDADDLLAADKIERQMRRRGEGALSFGSVMHFFDSPVFDPKHKHPARVKSECALPFDFLANLWSENEMIQTSQWLVSRELSERAGRWNENLSVDDDGEYFARVVLAASQIVAEPESWTFYRKFRTGPNLSATVHRNQAGRRSALHAAMLKGARLLELFDSSASREAVRCIVSCEIIAAYPAWPDLVEEGMAFLREHNLALSNRAEGSPWFRRTSRCLGWRAARRLQHRVALLRSAAPISEFLCPSATARPAALPAEPDWGPAAAVPCNRPRAISHLPV